MTLVNPKSAQVLPTRALPTLALAAMLAGGLTGCSTSEPAEQAPEPEVTTQQQGPETTEAPEKENEPAESASPATEFDTQEKAVAIQKDQLIASTDSYADMIDEPNRTEYTYDEAGRMTSLVYVGTEFNTTWTYDKAGNLLTQTSVEDMNGETYTSTITYTYNSEDLPVERIYESTQPPMYANSETGEMTDDPSQGEPIVWDVPKRTYEWSERGAVAKATEYDAEGNVERIYDYTYQTPLTVPTFSVSADPLARMGIGAIEDGLLPLTAKALDSDGKQLTDTTYRYNGEGEPLSSSMAFQGTTFTEEWTYDDHGNATSYTSSDFGETTYDWTYDEAGRPIEKVTAGEFDKTKVYDFFAYDSKGRLKAVTNATALENGERYASCTIYNYAADNEDLDATAQQLIDDAKEKVEAEMKGNQ